MTKRLAFGLLFAVLVLAAIGPAATYLSTIGAAATASTPANDWAMALQAPPFLDVALAAPARQGTIGDFLASEKAGITAYTNVNKE